MKALPTNLQCTEELDLDYLRYYINGLDIMQYAEDQVTRPKLNKSDLNRIPVVFPDLRGQQDIVIRLRGIEKAINCVRDYLHTIENLKDKIESDLNDLIVTTIGHAINNSKL